MVLFAWNSVATITVMIDKWNKAEQSSSTWIYSECVHVHRKSEAVWHSRLLVIFEYVACVHIADILR